MSQLDNSADDPSLSEYIATGCSACLLITSIYLLGVEIREWSIPPLTKALLLITFSVALFVFNFAFYQCGLGSGALTTAISAFVVLSTVPGSDEGVYWFGALTLFILSLVVAMRAWQRVVEFFEFRQLIIMKMVKDAQPPEQEKDEDESLYEQTEEVAA